MKTYTGFAKKYVVIATVAVGVCAAGLMIYGRMARTLDCTVIAQEPANLGLLKQEIKQYRDSGEWEHATACVVQEAEKTLQRYIPVGDKKLAIIFDIDETAVSSWGLMLILDFGYNHDRYKEWEMAAKAEPIAPIRTVYNFVKYNGFATFFITSRREDQRESTIKNLENAGFHKWDGLFCKPMDYVGNKAGEYKSKWRAYIQKLGYVLVASFGDQESDFSGNPRATHNFKIPNPVYVLP